MELTRPHVPRGRSGARRRGPRAAGDGRPLRPPRAARDLEGLALRLRRGEPRALETLVAAYEGVLYGYALRLTGDESDAQEIAQDAFLRAHRAITSRYDEERCRALQLRPWLLRIVRNLSLNRLRERRSVRLDPLPGADGWHAAELRSPLRAEDRLAARERAAGLERALARLPRADREIVQLRFVESLSYAEIGAVARCSEAAARGKVFRALARLRATFEESEVFDAM